LKEEKIEELFEMEASGQGIDLTVDLAAQVIRLPSGEALSFDVDSFRKRCLLEGLDDIGVTLTDAEAIRTFEVGHRQRAPWLFASPG
jgi:3-isopropylmalate/(R)-2-methylmalate dehydratase small subunit